MSKQFLTQAIRGGNRVPAVGAIAAFKVCGDLEEPVQKSAISLLSYAIAFSLSFTSASVAQEKAATFHEELVGGTVVPAATQEQFGLLTLSNPEGTCSASMLNDYWAITAAHCVYSQKTGLAFQASQITLKANWPSNHKSAQALQVVAYSSGTSAEKDIALLQMGLYDFTRADQTERKLQSDRGVGNTTVTAYGRGINVLASGLGAAATATQSDGQYRTALFSLFGVPAGAASFSYSGTKGATIAGGDSGGPSYIQDWDNPLSINRKLEYRLLGVHSRCSTTCITGKDCTTNPWQWVSAVSSCTDAAVYPVQDSIREVIQEIPASREFVGTFGTTPPNYQPIWLYVVRENGTLSWYRQDSSDAKWQGPASVGNGWQGFADVIPAGGDSMYGVTPTGDLLWYQHNGFNNGAFDWKGPVTVGTGWNNFAKIFSGADGIVYAIQQDGTLLWYRHVDYATGGRTWEGPRVVGTGWGSFKDVFSMGDGIIYGVQQDGALVWYNHTGHATGEFSWAGPYVVGSGWQEFTRIMPAGGGVILAIRPDGGLLWYRHQNYAVGVSISSAAGTRTNKTPHAIWQGGVQIGSGWSGFLNVFALLPSAPEAPR